MENKIYKPKEFGKMINRSVITLQKWDRDGVLKAHRTSTNRRYYTNEDYYCPLRQPRLHCLFGIDVSP